MLVALSVLVVIVAIGYLIWYREGLQGTFLPADYPPRTSGADIKFLGKTATSEQCGSECLKRGWCKGHTWYTGTAPNYGQDCYGFRAPGDVRLQQGAVSEKTGVLARLFSDNAGNRDEFRANTTAGTFDQYRENYYSVHDTPNGPVETFGCGY